MRNKPDGTVELDDDERGRIMLLAARYGLKWAIFIGTFFLIFSFIFFPDMIRQATHWYPFSFFGMFFWKRHWLIAQANEIIARTNARVKEEIDRS